MQMDQENKERTAVKKHSPPIEKKKVCVCNENIGGCRMCGGKMYMLEHFNIHVLGQI